MGWKSRFTSDSGKSESTYDPRRSAGSTSSVRAAPTAPSTRTTARPASSPSTSVPMGRSSGSATTANGVAASPPISQAHAQRLKARGLNPILCAQLGVHTVDNRTLGFHYFAHGEIHNTKLRRGKGNMPWATGGKELILWNLDCLRADAEADEEVIITEGELDAIACIQVGHTRVVSVPNGAQTGEHGFQYLHAGSALLPDLDKFERFILAVDGDRKGIECRDALAVRLGDERCRWVAYPEGCKDANDVLQKHGPEALRELLANARPMWTDEVARMGDVPDPPQDEARYRLGIPELDQHGCRITLPVFWPVIGPYGAGKSVLLRQLLCGFYELHGWRCLLTSFEERIKPRYQRDLRRHFIGRPVLPDAPWTAEEIAEADAKINDGFVFLRRAKGKTVDPERLLDRIEYAVRVYGVRVVAIDPVNEIRFRVPPGQSKTDYLGDFIMQLKDLSDDYGLCVICCAHPPKDATERRLLRGGMLTLNDGADTAHWGNKADMGWCVWRNVNGPTLLHLDKIKDHETMGRPTLVELELDRALGRFKVRRLGYDILGDQQAAKAREAA
jgi:twinkle protein